MFLVVSAAPIIVLSEINYETQKQLVTKQLENDLKIIASDRMNQVSQLWDLRVQQIKILAANSMIQSLFDSNPDKLNDTKKVLMDTELVEFQSATGGGSGFFDFIVTSMDGMVVFSTNTTLEGKDYSHDPKFIRGLSESFYDVKFNKPNSKPYLVVTVPIYSHKHKQIGVLIATRDIALAESITTNRAGLQQTGETYLVNQDKAMLTPSRFIPDTPKITVDTIPVRACFDEGKSISGIWNDYRPNGGIPVFGGSFCDRDRGFVMLAELDVAEALAPIGIIRYGVFISALAVILTSAVLGFFASRPILIPVRNLVNTTKSISEGRFDTRIKSKRTDEIGVLEKSFDFMMDEIQKLVKVNEEKNKTISEQLYQLQQEQKEKEEFVSMMTHDLKSPISPITGYAEMLSDQSLGELNEKQLNAVQKIGKNSKKLLALIQDLLDAYRIDLGKLSLEKKPTYIKKAIQNCVERYLPLAQQKNIELKIDAEDIALDCDESKVDRILGNLVDNAIRFVPENTGVIEVGANSKDGSVEFYVKDNGIGISPENQKFMFQKFYQIGAAKSGNVGLGLAICHGLVALHGGKIWVESEEGKGCTFYFSIPKNDTHEKGE